VNVSPLRDMIGRSVLGLFGAVLVIIGPASALGWRPYGPSGYPRWFDVLTGLGMLTAGLDFIRIVRTGKVPKMSLGPWLIRIARTGKVPKD